MKNSIINFKKTALALTGLAAMALVSSCGNNQAKQGPADTITSGVISISADESFAPIMDQEIDVFENVYNQASIIPLYSSEVDAINLLLKDSVHLAITTRVLTEGETAALEENSKLFPKAIMLATDAIALIINRDNTDSLLTTGQLRKILSGEISSWKQINPQSKLGDITFVFDNPNSGMLRFLQDSIAKGAPLSDKLFAQNGNKEVIDYVTQTPGAMGVVGVSWVLDQTDTTRLTFDPKIRVMAVTDQAKADQYNTFKPYQAYMATGEYPLSRYVYGILTDPRDGLATGFVTFLASDKGQRVILRAGLVPATQSIRLVNVRDNL